MQAGKAIVTRISTETGVLHWSYGYSAHYLWQFLESKTLNSGTHMIMAVCGGDSTSTLTTPLQFGRIFVTNGFPSGNGDTFYESNTLYTSYIIIALRIIDENNIVACLFIKYNAHFGNK